MIVSRAFLEAYKADRLRAWLGGHVKVREILDFRNAYVFPGVGITTAIVRFTHATRGVGNAIARRFQPSSIPPGVASRVVRDPALFREFSVAQKQFGKASWTFVDPHEQDVLSRIDKVGTPVGKILHIGQGMQTGANTVFGGLRPDDPAAAGLVAATKHVTLRSPAEERVLNHAQDLLHDAVRLAELAREPSGT